MVHLATIISLTVALASSLVSGGSKKFDILWQGCKDSCDCKEPIGSQILIHGSGKCQKTNLGPNHAIQGHNWTWKAHSKKEDPTKYGECHLYFFSDENCQQESPGGLNNINDFKKFGVCMPNAYTEAGSVALQCTRPDDQDSVDLENLMEHPDFAHCVERSGYDSCTQGVEALDDAFIPDYRLDW